MVQLQEIQTMAEVLRTGLTRILTAGQVKGAATKREVNVVRT